MDKVLRHFSEQAWFTLLSVGVQQDWRFGETKTLNVARPTENQNLKGHDRSCYFPSQPAVAETPPTQTWQPEADVGP